VPICCGLSTAIPAAHVHLIHPPNLNFPICARNIFSGLPPGKICIVGYPSPYF
jgi:hypothetical protein